MTRHERFAELTGVEEPVHIEAMEMIIAELQESNPFLDFGWCLKKYRDVIDWLNEEE